MIPRASYSEPFNQQIRDWRRQQCLRALMGVAALIGAAAIALAAGHAVLTTLLNLTFPGTPPGCC